jgi:hypothetical protein
MMEEGIRPLPEKEKRISESKPQIKTLVLEKEAISELTKKIEECILRSQKFLLAAQSEEGYWNSELLVDPLTICDYIIFLHWSGISNPELEEKAAKHLLKEQHSDGGWGQYTGSPSNIDLSVKAYHILKIAGISARDPRMVRARATILRMGGIPKTNTYTKFYLALVGQFPWKYLPSIPPELMLLPNCLFLISTSSPPGPGQWWYPCPFLTTLSPHGIFLPSIRLMSCILMELKRKIFLCHGIRSSFHGGTFSFLLIAS